MVLFFVSILEQEERRSESRNNLGKVTCVLEYSLVQSLVSFHKFDAASVEETFIIVSELENIYFV